MIGRIGGAPIGSAATEMTHRKAITNGKSLNSMTMMSGRPKTDQCGDEPVYNLYVHLVNNKNEHIFVNILLKFERLFYVPALSFLMLYHLLRKYPGQCASGLSNADITVCEAKVKELFPPWKTAPLSVEERIQLFGNAINCRRKRGECTQTFQLQCFTAP